LEARWVGEELRVGAASNSTLLSIFCPEFRIMTVTESLALRMLDREGIAIIWQLHTAAATADRAGNARAAAAILELAEAAERKWLSNSTTAAK
jgi:hypothetical protein